MLASDEQSCLAPHAPRDFWAVDGQGQIARFLCHPSTHWPPPNWGIRPSGAWPTRRHDGRSYERHVRYDTFGSGLEVLEFIRRGPDAFAPLSAKTLRRLRRMRENPKVFPSSWLIGWPRDSDYRTQAASLASKVDQSLKKFEFSTRTLPNGETHEYRLAVPRGDHDPPPDLLAELQPLSQDLLILEHGEVFEQVKAQWQGEGAMPYALYEHDGRGQLGSYRLQTPARRHDWWLHGELPPEVGARCDTWSKGIRFDETPVVELTRWFA